MTARTTGPAAAPMTAPTASQSGLNTPDILADVRPVRDPRFVRASVARRGRVCANWRGRHTINFDEQRRSEAYTVDGGGDFEEFVRAKRGPLVRSAYLLTGDAHLAEDLVQSALARTHRSWSRLTDPANAEAYTRKVMYHLQVSWWRRNRVAESVTDEAPEPRPTGGPGEATGLTNRMTIHGALGKLSAKQRAVLVYRYFEDRSEAETAALMGVQIGTVKSQTAKALVRLRAVAPELAELYAARVSGAVADDDED